MISKKKERYRNIKESYLSIKKIYRNVFYSILIAILTLFVGLIISFIITKVMPGDPLRALLPRNATREQYLALRHELGFDQPLIIQFFRYIGDLFTGNWGVSISFAPGEDVWELFKERLPRMVELLTVSATIGLPIGILFGKISIKYKDKWADKVIRMLAIIGISAPVFWLGLIFQYVFTIQLDWLPAFVFESGNWEYYIMPVSILTIAISSLIILQTRSALESESVERSIISNTVLIEKSFGLIIMFYILTELTFGINGVGIMLIDALNEHDIFYLVGYGFLFVLILTLVIITFIANIMFSLYRYITLESRTAPSVLNNIKTGEDGVTNVG